MCVTGIITRLEKDQVLSVFLFVGMKVLFLFFPLLLDFQKSET